MEKKSVLTAKLNSSSLNKEVLPPITANSSRKVSSNAEKSSNATAFQVTFDDNDKIKDKQSEQASSSIEHKVPNNYQEVCFALWNMTPQ